MKITERLFGDVIVLDLNGALAGRKAGETLAAAVRRHSRDGTRKVVANLGGVPSVDLGGLGALLDAHMELRKAGALFGLACITGRIHDLIVITRLLTVFDTYDSVEDAVGRPALARGGVDVAPLPLPSLGMIYRFLRRA